jgi:glycosyltransferase involved in cell wall biosynthesis
MKIALVGSRVGYIDRGFESFSRSLFDLLAPDIDITLFKGGGNRTKNEVVISTPWCEKGLLSQLGVSHNSRVLIQERAFAVGMLPHLFGDRFDIIHFSEVVLGKTLLRLRRLFGFRYRLVFSNGAPAPPLFYEPFDLTQEVTDTRLQEALKFGIPAARLRLVPYGIDCDRFSAVSPAAKARLRVKHGLPQDRVVVLCAAAIKSHHKRIDHLIEEMGRLDPTRYFLLVAGHRTDETPALEAQAKARLGANYRFVTLPHHEMHEVYQASDIFALASLTEGLGIVILEAMAASLPVVVHHDDSFRWVVAHEESLVDMAMPGNMARRVEQLGQDASLRHSVGSMLCEETRRRFAWQNVKPDYLALYQHALTIPALP